MTEPLQPAVMLEQAERLAFDVRDLAPAWSARLRALLPAAVCASVDHVYLIGSGDSYYASRAAEMAFESVADVACKPLSTHYFLEYAVDWMQAAAPCRSLLVATSASGSTPGVVQAAQRARERGAVTLAVTGVADSPLTRAAAHTLVVDLPDSERSPGIRTYQASLLALLLLSVHLAECRGRNTSALAHELSDGLATLSDAVERTNAAVRPHAAAIAERLVASPVVSVVGGGPCFGTALYAAAKLTEAAGIPALGQDLDEWWHVERFANPVDMPLVVIAPLGRSLARASRLAADARALGRWVLVVTHRDAVEVSQQADALLRVHGDVSEPCSPLLYHVFASHVASWAAARLGTPLFRGGRR